MSTTTFSIVGNDVSDGYHTFGELYRYRMAYHALLASEWANQGIYNVHKSMNHSDGEPCFGGGWFIVVATLPTGQISNHYKMEFWDAFRVPTVSIPAAYDGHTPETALARLEHLLQLNQQNEVQNP